MSSTGWSYGMVLLAGAFKEIVDEHPVQPEDVDEKDEGFEESRNIEVEMPVSGMVLKVISNDLKA